MPSNHKDSSELLDLEDFRVNSSLKVAESRVFPAGSSDSVPLNLVSPFDVVTFGKQLLPLLSVNIKEKVKDFARTFESSADAVEDAIRESWRESPLNPHNFKQMLDEAPNLFKHLPFPPVHVTNTQHKQRDSPNSLRKPVAQHPKAHNTKAHKKRAPKAIETYSLDGLKHEYGINGFKHFEESILRELEKQEEQKVEATIHTLFEQGDRVEIIQGKPYDFKSGWEPVSAPTKNYEDNSSINSQIISPLHTSIFSGSQHSSVSPHGSFYDFDNLNGNTVHSTYSVHEEEGESKVKPVKTKISTLRKLAPSSPSNVYTKSSTTKNSSHRKRHNHNATKTVGLHNMFVTDSTSDNHDAPRVVNKSKRNPQRHHHIQSLTTSKPRNSLSQSKIAVAEELPKLESGEHLGRVSYSYGSEPPTRLRSSTRSSATTAATTTTVKPSRNVAREASKFVDKPKATGYRGSVRFGQTTTKKPV